MLYYAGIFFTAVMAAIFGLGIALGATEIAATLFFICLILLFGSLVYGVTGRIP